MVSRIVRIVSFTFLFFMEVFTVADEKKAAPEAAKKEEPIRAKLDQKDVNRLKRLDEQENKIRENAQQALMPIQIAKREIIYDYFEHNGEGSVNYDLAKKEAILIKGPSHNAAEGQGAPPAGGTSDTEAPAEEVEEAKMDPRQPK